MSINKPVSIPEPTGFSGQMSPGGFGKWAIIPPHATECIAIFVKQFLQNAEGWEKSGSGE
ncbi:MULTISPECIES: hypothetical protein [Citrobacter]|uniref:hypothetical protein n=1 Tax=Citrobacter TaxID=544 RepID=UPI0012B0B5DD|nr:MULTISPECIES: hypothetical protein [Citrobacter]EKW3841313.1 hypothetical protein [Citrobacter amalonaticus]EKW5058438.1 hypothetical protein [Citrobacter amalonaticus]EKX8496005.1 hypothetical protein [Citrobacter amalonaticus]ELB4226118.1 hypothetical protein [Citrobacter amalonaticus]ELO0857276.1 hypothetical protein [Citrobacter amalonaticus]